MLFNSFVFIIGFLPAFVVLYRLAEQYDIRAALIVIGVASLIFYGWWNPPDVLLLIASIIFNFVIARAMLRQSPEDTIRSVLFWVGVGLNLTVLAYFKYAYFLADLFNDLNFAASPVALGTIVLPLAISFYTFQQISFLMDVRRGGVNKVGFVSYAAFIGFFPQLIAGPIVRFGELVPQFEKRRLEGPVRASAFWRNVHIGGTIFCLGLVKKVVFADTLSEFSEPAFAMAAAGQNPTMIIAWLGAFAFTFQIYFDFSGYSDMAIGLAALLGLRLPINFLSPYKAPNIAEFWRRWNITLTRFFQSSIYTPLTLYLTRLAGRSITRPWVDFLAMTLIPVPLTFALIGLWHGAGWQFVLFGLMHAVFLVVHRLWSDKRLISAPLLHINKNLAIAITFVAVTVSFVLFRADSPGAALLYYQNMFLPQHLVFPKSFASLLSPIRIVLDTFGITFAKLEHWHGARSLVWLLMSFAVCFAMPNLMEIFRRYRPALDLSPRENAATPQWRTSRYLGFFALFVLAATWFLVFFLQGSALQLQAWSRHTAFVETLLGTCALLAVLLLWLVPREALHFEWRSTPIQAVVTGGLLAGSLIVMMGGKGNAFIYFAF